MLKFHPIIPLPISSPSAEICEICEICGNLSLAFRFCPAGGRGGGAVPGSRLPRCEGEDEGENLKTRKPET
jgi:hypothetical protein